MTGDTYAPAPFRQPPAPAPAPDGVEFVQGLHFEGHAELADRVARAYEAFVATNSFVAGYDEDLSVHQDIPDIPRFTITPSEPAWSARVFLLLDDDGKVQQSYQVTVKPLPSLTERGPTTSPLTGGRAKQRGHP